MKLIALLATAAGIATTSFAHAETTTYTIDPTHTFVTFEAARHFNTSTLRGRFDKTEGKVEYDSAAKSGKAEIAIDLASVSTGVEDLNSHLKGEDFFNVAKNPTARFVGDKFTFEGDKVTSVDGTLELNGQTNPVTLKASNFNCYDNPMFKKQVCGGDFETTITRSKWGMTFGTPGIPDDIRLLIQVEAVKQ